MGDKNYETRHIFMAVAICILIYSPVLLSFVPQTVANIMHYQEGDWYVFAPSENFKTFGVGFLFLFIASMSLFLLDIKQVSLFLSGLLLFLSLGCFFVAAQSHKTLSDDSITFSPIFSLKDYSYSWDDVEKIVYYYDENDGYKAYEFIFTDGNTMMLENDAYFKAIRYKYDYKLKEMNIVTVSSE